MGDRLRVVSLNTWKCDGDYRARLTWMADGLRALHPNIVFLQEAFECAATGDDTAASLGEALGLHVAQVQGRQKLRHHLGELLESSSNLAILTRKPLQHAASERLAPCAGDEDRMMQIADVSLDGMSLRLCNVHFTHIPGAAGDAARLAQAAQLAKAGEPPMHGLAILGGDLNATPDQDGVQTLAGTDGLLAPEASHVSGTFHGEADGGTTERKTLDYLFVRRSETAPTVRFSHLWQSLDKPIGAHGQFASDHAAVVADLTVA